LELRWRCKRWIFIDTSCNHQQKRERKVFFMLGGFWLDTWRKSTQSRSERVIREPIKWMSYNEAIPYSIGNGQQ
jgi:hypothetical protein